MRHYSSFGLQKTLTSLFLFIGFAVVGYSQSAPVASNATICSGNGVRLTVTSAATGSNYFRWYKNANLTNLLSQGSSFQTPALAATTNYYVVETNAATGVNSANVKTVIVTVNATPVAPTVAAGSVCSGKRLLLSATGSGGTVHWYSDAAGLVSIGTGLTYNTPVLSQTTSYYARETSAAGCVSPMKAATVSVYALPAAPTTAPSTAICMGTSTMLSATGGNATTAWFSNATGTANVGIGTSFTTPTLNATTSYWAANVSARGCLSPLAKATVFTRAVPAAAAITAAPAICAGKMATIRATGLGVAEWHIDAATNPIAFTGGTYTTTALSATKTYFVVMNNAGCKGVSNSTAVTVNAIPAAPTTAMATVCAGQNAMLDATGNTGVISWYSDGSGANRLSVGTTYMTSALVQDATYYASQTVNGCLSPLKAVMVMVNPLPSTPLVTTSPTVCRGETAVVRATNVSSASIWYDRITATPTDSVGRGAIFTTPALTSSTAYYIQNMNVATGCKSDLASAPITVNAAPYANAGANKTIKYGETIELKAAGGVNYKWSPPTSLDNPYIFNPMASPEATTTYVVTVSDENGCTASDFVTITVSTQPADGAVINLITPNGDGVNDEWELPFLYKFDGSYTLKIYARAGNEVYSTTNYDQKWNAKLNGGDLPEGTYWYILVIAGDRKDYRGAITVKR